MGAAPSLDDDGADADEDEIIPMASGRLSVSLLQIYHIKYPKGGKSSTKSPKEIEKKIDLFLWG